MDRTINITIKAREAFTGAFSKLREEMSKTFDKSGGGVMGSLNMALPFLRVGAAMEGIRAGLSAIDVAAEAFSGDIQAAAEGLKKMPMGIGAVATTLETVLGKWTGISDEIEKNNRIAQMQAGIYTKMADQAERLRTTLQGVADKTRDMQLNAWKEAGSGLEGERRGIVVSSARERREIERGRMSELRNIERETHQNYLDAVAIPASSKELGDAAAKLFPGKMQLTGEQYSQVKQEADRLRRQQENVRMEADRANRSRKVNSTYDAQLAEVNKEAAQGLTGIRARGLGLQIRAKLGITDQVASNLKQAGEQFIEAQAANRRRELLMGGLGAVGLGPMTAIIGTILNGIGRRMAWGEAAQEAPGLAGAADTRGPARSYGMAAIAGGRLTGYGYTGTNAYGMSAGGPSREAQELGQIKKVVQKQEQNGKDANDLLGKVVALLKDGHLM